MLNIPPGEHGALASRIEEEKEADSHYRLTLRVSRTEEYPSFTDDETEAREAF